MTIRTTESRGRYTAPGTPYAKETTFYHRCGNGHEWDTWGFVYGAFQGISSTQMSCPTCGEPPIVILFG